MEKGLSRRKDRAVRSATFVSGVMCVLALSGCLSQPEPRSLAADPLTQQLLIAGSEAFDRLDFRTALALADSAERRAPKVPETYFLRGRIYSAMMRWADAEAQYKKVIELEPGYIGVWNNLGNNAFRQQEYRQAIAYFRKEIAYNPAPIPWHGMGRAYRELGVMDSAQYAYERSIAVDSTYAAAYLNLAILLQDEGAFSEALDVARRGARVRPDDIELQYQIGALLMQLGRPEQALQYLATVATEWSWHYPSRYNLGQALARLGRGDEAQAVLKQAEALRAAQAKIESMEMVVQARPGDPLAHAGLASLLRRAGRYDDAMRAYQVAYSLDPANLEFQNNIANLHLIRGDTTASIQWYRNILQQDPEFIDVWLNLGVVYAISGHAREAREAWEMVLQLDPGHAAAKQYLARLPRS